jgi:lipid-A-disaccharide synthase-like uncharacterized protein
MFSSLYLTITSNNSGLFFFPLHPQMEWIQKYWVFGLGFFAQFFFGIRLIAQWIQSEKAGRVVSPVSFWQLSLLAAIIFLVYGILRDDAVIIIGQLITYFIYIRNLQLKNAWTAMHVVFKAFAWITPFVAFGWITFGTRHNWNDILSSTDFSHPIVLLGVSGQVILSLRFIYQWYYSEKRKTSILPFMFWVISALGSFIVGIYATYRRDPVLFLSAVIGLFIYSRNMMLQKRNEYSEDPGA